MPWQRGESISEMLADFKRRTPKDEIANGPQKQKAVYPTQHD